LLSGRPFLRERRPSERFGKLIFIAPFEIGDAVRIAARMDIYPASRWHMPRFVEQTGGFFPTKDTIVREISAYDELDLVRAVWRSGPRARQGQAGARFRSTLRAQSPRQVNSRRGVNSWRRATCNTTAPGARVS